MTTPFGRLPSGVDHDDVTRSTPEPQIQQKKKKKEKEEKEKKEKKESHPTPKGQNVSKGDWTTSEKLKEAEEAEPAETEKG